MTAQSNRPVRTALVLVPLFGAMSCGVASEVMPPSTSPTPPSADRAAPAPPGVPAAATARAQLAGLRVAPQRSMNGYDRDKFPHWNEAPGENCNTREYVLRRDGEGVRTGTDCYPTAGTWHSPYDDGTWTDPADLDVDHVVPLAAAWRSGAAEWSTDKRERFTNDIDSPQLLAVTDNVNQEKGDDTPDEWLPPNSDYHCTYAAAWVAVKHKWELTVTGAEKTKLSSVLSSC